MVCTQKLICRETCDCQNISPLKITTGRLANIDHS